MADSSPDVPFTIYLRPDAPAKPAPGAPCNGCGVCCSVAPCPLGQVLTRTRRGPCALLRWHAGRGAYLCGALTDAGRVVSDMVPRRFAGLARLLAPVFARLARRWIAAGRGCDSDLLAEPEIRDAGSVVLPVEPPTRCRGGSDPKTGQDVGFGSTQAGPDTGNRKTTW